MRLQSGDKVVFIGDSITDCGRAQPVGEGSSGGLGNGWVSLVDALIGAQHPDLLVRIVNVGTSGNTVRDLKARWERDVTAQEPDWVSIMIGVNDVWRQFDSPTIPEAGVPLDEYRQTLQELIDRVQQNVKGIVLMTPFFLEPNQNDAMRAKLDEYGQAVKELAVEKGCLLVDAQAAMDQILEHRYSASIGWDRVHVNTTGNMVLALEWLEAMDGAPSA